MTETENKASLNSTIGSSPDASIDKSSEPISGTSLLVEQENVNSIDNQHEFDTTFSTHNAQSSSVKTEICITPKSDFQPLIKTPGNCNEENKKSKSVPDGVCKLKESHTECENDENSSQQKDSNEQVCPSNGTSFPAEHSNPVTEQENETAKNAVETKQDLPETIARRSDRKAKSFARVRLVLAHEQIVDDDNYLGFTNTKTYRPPKKRRKLCQFKGENNLTKPKDKKICDTSLQSNKPIINKTSSKSNKPKITPSPAESSEKDNSPENETILSTTDNKKLKTAKVNLKSSKKPEVYTCKHCNYKTKDKYYIKRHRITHNKPRISFECHYCEFATRSLIRHKEHEAKHTKEKPFKCLNCEYCSRSHTDFKRHQAKHSTEKKYKCPLCDFTTKWSRNVRHHVLRHNTARPHKCHICGFCFKRSQDLKYHLYRHTDSKPIACDSCEFRCKTNYELRCHKLKHSDQRFFSCTFPGCTQQTKTKSDLTKHMCIHKTEKNCICSVCGKGFNSRSSLAKHVQIHGERELLTCDICQKHLKTRSSLQLHLKLHLGVYPFACDICGKKFSVKWNLVKHQETHMLNDRPYRCPICPYGARTMEHLLTHIGSMHGKSYAYFCELCRKPFKRYGQLKIHMGRMHSTELDQSTMPEMHSMLKEVPNKSEINLKQELSEATLELVEVKQEPIDECSLSSSDSFNPTVVKTELADQEDSDDAPLSSYLPASSTREQKPLATVGIYNGISLPLARKGFEFNLEKRGKKPASWFMDPKHMDRKSAAKHKKYLFKKERGLIPSKKPKLPTNRVERETERTRRRRQKFITSCRVSTKNETTLIFHTERSPDASQKPIRATVPRKNTVAALLLECKKKPDSASTPLSSSTSLQSKSSVKEKPKAKPTSKRKNATRSQKILNPKNSSLLKSSDVVDKPLTKESSKIQGDRAQISNEDTTPKKRGRPKGSKNKKNTPSSPAKILLVRHSDVASLPEKKTPEPPVKKYKPKKKSFTKIVADSVSDSTTKPEKRERPQKKKKPKASEVKESDMQNNDKPLPKKRKGGRPKGSLNKKTLEVRERVANTVQSVIPEKSEMVLATPCSNPEPNGLNTGCYTGEDVNKESAEPQIQGSGSQNKNILNCSVSLKALPSKEPCTGSASTDSVNDQLIQANHMEQIVIQSPSDAEPEATQNSVESSSLPTTPESPRKKRKPAKSEIKRKCKIAKTINESHILNTESSLNNPQCKPVFSKDTDSGTHPGETQLHTPSRSTCVADDTMVKLEPCDQTFATIAFENTKVTSEGGAFVDELRSDTSVSNSNE